jgi:hypothetical protein
MQIIRWFGAGAVGALLVTVATIYLRHEPATKPSLAAAVVKQAPIAVQATAPVTASPPAHLVTTGTGKPVSVVTLKKRFLDARDYFDFAHAILVAAQAGNAEAQYYLWLVRFTCEHDPVSTYATVDEAEQFGARVSIPMEDVHKNYGHCHKLRSQDVSDLGDQWDWLNRSIKAGQPNALATGAQLGIMQEREKATPNGSHWLPQDPVGAGADPRQLALKAVQSRDPGALIQIGNMTNLLNPRESPQESVVNRLAWTVAACQQTGGCSDCGSDCDPATLMSQAGNNWGAVQQRAREIAEKLDSGQWDQLGIGLGSP